MPTLQSAYTDNLPVAYAGMVANGETSNRISRTVETAAGIGFGVPVYRGSGDHGCVSTVGTLATFLGFTIANQGMGYVAGQDADEYQQYDTAAIMTSGAIFVNVTGNVADGDALSINTSTGAISNAAVSGTQIATGWIADQTLTGGGIVRIVKR